MFKVLNQCRVNNIWVAFASKVVPKRSFASCLKGGILEFLALIKD